MISFNMINQHYFLDVVTVNFEFSSYSNVAGEFASAV